MKTVKPGFKRPVIIHRAILGSFERCIGILIEHFGGKWPFWISPRQAMVIPVTKIHNDYAELVKNTLVLKGYYVDVDLGNNTLNKKIRLA